VVTAGKGGSRDTKITPVESCVKRASVMGDIAAKARVRAFDVVASMGLHTRRP